VRTLRPTVRCFTIAETDSNLTELCTGMNRVVLFIALTIATSRGQILNTLPTPPPRLNPDLTVTYFFNAPNAKEVRLLDTTHSPGPPGLPMTRGADGMWSVTTRPYELGTHAYGFVVDGVVTGDLFSTAAAERLPRPSVLFETLDVRGSQPLFTDIEKVPHGTVHIDTFSSNTLGREVRVFVYTPPAFTPGEAPPIVYLLHGAALDERAWTQLGYADRIVDNLIAKAQAGRIILAMPDVSGINRANLPPDVIERYLLTDVFPFIENKYLGRESSRRYLAGFSAGANHARFTGLRNPSMFTGLGMFGGGGLAMGNLIELHPAAGRPELFQHMRVIYFAVGNQDPALVNVRRISAALGQTGIANHLNVSSGGHDWFNFRRYLAEFLKAM
jgi:enterochelin esterase-like enzyme